MHALLGRSLACAGLGVWMLTLGCASAAPPAVPPPALPAPRPSEPQLVDRDWGVLRSAAHGLKLALPEARAWFAPSTAPGASWELRHEPTGTSVSVRRWRATRLPHVEQCDRELRQRVPELGVADETSLVGERSVRVPQGFVTRITLLALPGNGQRLRGQALAVGAGVGECIAAIARTECTSEAELAERLRLLDAAFAHLRLTHVEDRVPKPAPLPS
jgi:hypothetical protein